ncbi:MAG: NAD-dependent deacylase [Candidatus Fermentibacteraceae bacterium]
MNGYEEAKILLDSSKRTLVFTGAGMSSESGMSTFRGVGGLWNDFSAQELSSIEGLRTNPGMVWEWYGKRFVARKGVVPHPGYRALLQLQNRKGRLPVVTQNVDGLHQAAGLTEVYELHGSMRTVSCLDGCGFSADFTDDHLRVLPPKCPGCGAVLRPDVVLFGESLPEKVIRDAFQLAGNWADLLLVVGTSMLVWPAAGIPWEALQSGVEIVELNPEPTSLSKAPGVIWIPGRAAEILPGLLEE